jgi:hypothetical protein
MELIVLALVGIAGPFIGAFVSGRVTSRIAIEQAQRGRRVELYTDLLQRCCRRLSAARARTRRCGR